jgi:hypothetical protein
MELVVTVFDAGTLAVPSEVSVGEGRSYTFLLLRSAGNADAALTATLVPSEGVEGLAEFASAGGRPVVTPASFVLQTSVEVGSGAVVGVVDGRHRRGAGRICLLSCSACVGACVGNHSCGCLCSARWPSVYLRLCLPVI